MYFFALFLIYNPIKQQQQQPEHKYIPFILLTLHSLNNTYFSAQGMYQIVTAAGASAVNKEKPE